MIVLLKISAPCAATPATIPLEKKKKSIIFMTKPEYYFLNSLFICYMCMLSHAVCWNQSNSIGKAFCSICPGQILVFATRGSCHKEYLLCKWSPWNQTYLPQNKPFSLWNKCSSFVILGCHELVFLKLLLLTASPCLSESFHPPSSFLQWQRCLLNYCWTTEWDSGICSTCLHKTLLVW